MKDTSYVGGDFKPFSFFVKRGTNLQELEFIVNSSWDKNPAGFTPQLFIESAKGYQLFGAYTSSLFA